MLSLVLENLPDLVNLHFIGKNYKAEIEDAVGIGTLWFTCFGTSIGYSFAAGLETVAA